MPTNARRSADRSDKEEMESYDVIGVTTPDTVPNWARQPKKWEKIVEQVMALAPNTTLTLHFKDAAAAERARATVREAINSARGIAVLRTRKVADKDGTGATLYFTRLSDEQAKREQKG
jgi:hypothetical protein